MSVVGRTRFKILRDAFEVRSPEFCFLDSFKHVVLQIQSRLLPLSCTPKLVKGYAGCNASALAYINWKASAKGFATLPSPKISSPFAVRLRPNAYHGTNSVRGHSIPPLSGSNNFLLEVTANDAGLQFDYLPVEIIP
jgi:hypothetical protein